MKELIVILAIAAATFALAKPIALRFSAPADFARRRNVWLALTIIAFLSPNFWIFALFAAPIYVWAGRKDSNPIAAYLLLMHVVPPVPIDIPTIGISQLFTLDNYRLLSFCVLIPTALRARRSIDRKRTSDSRMTDLLLFAFGVVQIALFVPPDLPDHVILQDSPTNVLRRAFLVFIDIFVLYYAISRSCSDRRKIADAEAAFCVSAGIMSLVATFEHLRTWLLYKGLALRWNPLDTNFLMAWLFRGSSWLRTQASAGHPLVLGFLLAIAFGFLLYLQSRDTLRVRLMTGIVFLCGMVVTYSRGPWIGAILIFLAYSALKPRAVSRLFKAAFLIAIVLGLIGQSSVGEKIMNSLPFAAGGQPDATLLYRQRLADRSFELMRAHPYFGDQLAIQKMEDLRQGQGIIDIVNTYIGVALFTGWVGLALFLGFILSASMGAYRVAKSTISTDLDGGLLGFNILACIVGVLFMIADCSLIFGVEKMLYVLIALAAAYARQGKQMISPVAVRNSGSIHNKR